MNEWKDFFIAVAGAAATLTGLIFVGVSINLTRILSLPGLPIRAFLSLMLLITMLIISTLLLIPAQSLSCAGIEILVTGVIAWALALRNDLKIYKSKQAQFKGLYLFTMSLTQLATLPYIICGIVTLQAGGCGIYWIVPAIIFSFIKATMDAWVLLVEINR